MKMKYESWKWLHWNRFQGLICQEYFSFCGFSFEKRLFLTLNFQVDFKVTYLSLKLRTVKQKHSKIKITKNFNISLKLGGFFFLFCRAEIMFFKSKSNFQCRADIRTWNTVMCVPDTDMILLWTWSVKSRIISSKLCRIWYFCFKIVCLSTAVQSFNFCYTMKWPYPGKSQLCNICK